MSGETKEVFGSNYGQNDVIINGLIDKMTLFDDNLMSLVFGQNIETTELLLRVIMERDIKVIDVRGQDELKNPVIGGRCITLDVHAIDVDGRHIDIEVQINAEGSHVKRARYHSSMMDARMLEEGQEFKEIKDSYVIFIYDHDKFRKGLPFYHIQRRVDETGEAFGDGSHIIYVNGRYEGNDDIGRSHTQQEQEVEQHKYTASIFSGHIRKTPYVSDADGTAGADQDKAKPGAKTFTFHFLIPPLLLFHDNVPYYDSKKREKMQR